MGKKKRKGKYSKASARGYATTAVKSKTSQAQIDAFQAKPSSSSTSQSQSFSSTNPAEPTNVQPNTHTVTTNTSTKSASNNAAETYNDAPIELKIDQSRQLLEQRPTVLSLDPRVENVIFEKLLPYIAEANESLRRMAERKMRRQIEKSAKKASNALRRAYVTLEGLGLDAPVISDALTFGGSNIFHCLDYLCLSRSREDLPQGWYTEELTASSAAAPLKFMSRQKKEGGGSRKEEREEMEEEKLELMRAAEKEKVVDAGQVKEWILHRAQAQAEEAEEEEMELEQTPKQRQARLVKEILAKRKEAAAQENKSVRKAVGREIAALNTALRNLEKDFKLERLEEEDTPVVAEYKDSLPSESREEREEVVEMQKEAGEATVEPDEIADTGFGSLFEGEDEESGAAGGVEKVVTRVVEFELPKNWSGASPSDLLAEYCLKRYKQAPRFVRKRETGGMYFKFEAQLGGNLVIQMPPNEVCTSKQAAQEYTSLYALYKIDPSSGGGIRLAPVYQDLWLEWKLRDEEAQTQALVERRKPREDCIQQLIQVSLTTTAQLTLQTVFALVLVAKHQSV